MIVHSKLGELVRLVGDVEPERRHRDAAVVERGEIGAVRRFGKILAHIGDPVIGIAAAVLALVDMQPLLPAAALRGDRDALDLVRRGNREN